MDDDDDLYMETFVNKDIDTKISYPNHICVFGSTQSGKSSLVGEILDNVDKVYSLDKSKNKIYCVFTMVLGLETCY